MKKRSIFIACWTLILAVCICVGGWVWYPALSRPYYKQTGEDVAREFGYQEGDLLLDKTYCWDFRGSQCTWSMIFTTALTVDQFKQKMYGRNQSETEEVSAILDVFDQLSRNSPHPLRVNGRYVYSWTQRLARNPEMSEFEIKDVSQRIWRVAIFELSSTGDTYQWGEEKLDTNVIVLETFTRRIRVLS